MHSAATVHRCPRAMAYESYAEFLDALEKAGELIRVSEPIATELEITELADREMKKPGGGKALLIEQPTVNGEVSPMPVAINTMGSAKRIAMALGACAMLAGCKNPVDTRREPTDAAQARGRAAIQRAGCGSCHEIPGLDWPAGRLGPARDPRQKTA